MSRTRYKVVDNHYPYMLTATVIEWMPLLSRPDIVRILLDSMQFMQDNGRMTIFKKLHKTDRKYQFWQDGGKPKQISDRKIMTQKIEYMHFNPVRCGYIDLPAHWRYSSARNYQGEEGLISVCRDW